ncbi:iturin family lipopeptide synthetase C [Paenibacillus sp. CF095]|uniref:non-ribosomal peptide synthetase n=1 Tax=Paenibacillus sp. CF095 TaxID=1881033 RepID=UPI000886FDB9|nr:non-ribosomal peptide synthetase [Paenibacillus sp. CF095]SDD50974.1 iturin family lipopeptide synthetase C [Paenibacillus sp. CF095]
MSKKIEIDNIYSLSSMQEGLLFRALVHSGDGEYVLQSEFDVHGHINIEWFRKSFQILVDRHDILRTIFNYKKTNRSLQIVLKHRQTAVNVHDLRHLIESETVERIESFQDEDLKKGFDLTKDLLIRCTILHMENERYKLVLTYHHILMDGWCLGVIFNELLQIYHSFKSGLELRLPLAYPYSNFIKWIEEQDKEEASLYWKGLLADYGQPALLPQAQNRSLGRYNFQKYSFKLDHLTTNELKVLAQKSQVTLYNIMQTLWGILLQKYNNTTDVVFGAVVSGRPAEVVGVEQIIGLFINTIPIRIRQEDGQTFTELLSQVQRQVAEGNRYEYYPLYRIQSDAELKQDLFDHIISFENYPMHQKLQSTDTTIEDVGFRVVDFAMREQTNYDLNIIFIPGEEMKVVMTHNAEVYSIESLKMIEKHFKQLVRAVSADPESLLPDLEIVTDSERQTQLSFVFDSRVTYPENDTLSEIFERQVTKTPDSIAVSYENQNLTYHQLNLRANQLAYILRKKGIGPDKLVALLLDRSLDMIVAILATLKAGGAYVPMDPSFPIDRIHFMLNDSKAEVMITQGDFIGSEIYFKGDIITTSDSEITAAPSSNLPHVTKPHHLAYIIYTSGTTGKPKGVMIEHHNLVRLFFHDGCLFKFSGQDVWTLFHSYCFDFSVWEIFGALLHGGKLVIVPEQTVRDPDRFLQLLRAEKVTILNQTPTMFSYIMHKEAKQEISDLKLKMVIFGGEALSPYQLRGWKAKHPQVRLINMYGITETTVHATFNELTEKDIQENISNIGRPIPTLGLFLLDQNLNLLPQGAIGEMYISGEGVARGYLNRPELTKERFLPNPYIPGDVLYKTGDLGKWRNDWNLEYLGRSDQQVKIRGYRIELQEIEFCLQQHHDIKEAVVLPKENANGTVLLCAFVKSGYNLEVEEIKAYLSERLPSYMIPSLFYLIDQIPITSNGKVDRKSLLKKEHRSTLSSKNQAQITDEVEQDLFSIWEAVLGNSNFGVHDNFFEVGGNSILLIQVHNQIEERYPGKTSIAELFTYSTISMLKNKMKFLNPSDSGVENIIGMVLPSDYYLNDSLYEEGSQFRYFITGELYSRIVNICKYERVMISQLLQGIFVYTLSELSQVDHIPLHVMNVKGVIQLDVEFKNISGFSDLFNKISDRQTLGDGMYQLSNLNLARQQASIETVYPAFIDSSQDTITINFVEFFDFGVEWKDHKDEGELFFRYNSHRLEKEKMRFVYSQYIGFLKVFVENFK